MNTLKIAENTFKVLSPVLKPNIIQHGLRKLGVKLPYRFTKYLDYKGLVEFKIGDKHAVMQSYNTPIEITAFWKGIFGGREGAELRVWSALSKHISFCFDVGANTGVYSIVAATIEDTQVHSFEPVPNVYKMLERNIELNGFKNITTHEVVVSNKSGVETLYVPKEGWVDVASIEKKFAERYAEDNLMKEIQVPAVTLDEIVFNNKYQGYILVKIDVEGAEYKVLGGMSQVLGDGRAVVILEVLNQASFAQIKQFVPASYAFYGIKSKEPYIISTDIYERGVKNYLLVPNSLKDGIQSWIMS